MNDNWSAIIQLFGAGTLGAVLLKVVERVFMRADKKDDLATGLRIEMVDRIKKLENRTDTLESRLDTARRENQRLFAENAELRSENTGLRNRYHGVLQVVQQLVDRDTIYREKLGLPAEVVDIPTWVYQRLPGPTERVRDLRPDSKENS